MKKENIEALQWFVDFANLDLITIKPAIRDLSAAATPRGRCSRSLKRSATTLPTLIVCPGNIAKAQPIPIDTKAVTSPPRFIAPISARASSRMPRSILRSRTAAAIYYRTSKSNSDMAAGETITPDTFTVYTYNYNGNAYQVMPTSTWDWILNDFRAVYGWSPNDGQTPTQEVEAAGQVAEMFTSSSTAHVVPQAGSFASVAAADTALASVKSQGLGWLAAAKQISSEGHYVAGFEIVNPDNSLVEGEWLQVSLTNASFISYDLMTGTQLNGSFDQIEAEANDQTEGAYSSIAANLNPGVDLSWADNPFILLEANGTVSPGWDATFTPNLNFSNLGAGVYVDLVTGEAEDLATGQEQPIGAVQSITGSPFNDQFLVPIDQLPKLSINGGGGDDVLYVEGAGQVDLAAITGIETIYLDSSGANSLTIPNSAVGTTLVVYGGNAGNSINASGIAAGKTVYYYAGSGQDFFTGGAANSSIYVTLAELAGDKFTFGSGYNSLVLSNAGTVNLSGVTGTLSAIYLGNGGQNTLTVNNALVGSTLVVHAGTGGDTVDARALSANKSLYYYGGNENDTLYLTAAGLNSDYLTLGGGTNSVILTTAGAINLANVSGLNYLYLGKAATTP